MANEIQSSRSVHTSKESDENSMEVFPERDNQTRVCYNMPKAIKCIGTNAILDLDPNNEYIQIVLSAAQNSLLTQIFNMFTSLAH